MSEPAPRKHVRQSVSQDPVDYTPKNILVTGGAGFIASHIVIRLTRDYPQYTVSLAKRAPPPTRVTRCALAPASSVREDGRLQQKYGRWPLLLCLSRCVCPAVSRHLPRVHLP